MKISTMIYLNLIIVPGLSVCLTLDTEEASVPCEWNGIKGVCVNPQLCLTTLDGQSPRQPECDQDQDQDSDDWKPDDVRICCTDCKLVNSTRNFIVSASGGEFWKDGRKARDQCLQYLKELPHKCHQEGYYGGITRTFYKKGKCHSYSSWGIGGAPPPNAEPPRENPYEALIGFGEDIVSAVWMTAGAIISDKFILTSAHGHETTEGKFPVKFVALGVKNRKSDKNEWPIHKVKKIYQHPEYASNNTRYNDLTLLELETTIKFNKDVLPACMPDPYEQFSISTAKFSSWKQPTSRFADFTDTANIVKVEELIGKECDVKILETEHPVPVTYKKRLPNAVSETTQLCYGDNGTCLNLIGAPVVVTTYISRCMNTVVGVNAYGDRCGPAVFTKVSHYISWIESVVWP